MDPLFGFVDEISEQNTNANNTVLVTSTGGIGSEARNSYTLSFSEAGNSASSGVMQTFQQPTQAQVPGDRSSLSMVSTITTSTATTLSSATPLGFSQPPIVRLVAGKSEDNKQIYFVKFENPVQENLESGGVHQPQFLNVDAAGGGSSNFTEEDGGFEDENHNFGDDDNAETAESLENGQEDAGPDPNIAVSPEAVMAMAQSVGVDLNEDDAMQLGCMTINKLRHVVLLALQFSQNENEEGISVEHFSKAEEQVGYKSFGHESVFREAALKYAGGVSVVDDGPEIDLYAAMIKNNLKQREINIDSNEPILNVHRLHTHEENAKRNVSNSNSSDVYDEPVTTLIPESTGSDAVDNQQQFEDSNENVEIETSDENSSHDDSDSEIENICEGVELNPDPDNETEVLQPEWSTYIELLHEKALSHRNQEDHSYITPDFEMMLEDIHRNGANPVFHKICSIFRDELRNKDELSLTTIVNIISVVDALITSHCEPSLDQITDLGVTLVEVLLLPAPCELNPLLINVFMKIVKRCDKLLTWVCTYVTEMIKGISETPMSHFPDPLKCTLHGAICIANGLEDLNLTVANQFGWQNMVLAFSKNHSAVFDGQKYCHSLQDSYLEEEVLEFFHNFLKNYTKILTEEELTSFRETVVSIYGEKINSLELGTAKKVKYDTAKKLLQVPETRCVIRKGSFKKQIVQCQRL